MERGNLSINSENILPIIKKWLYSDTDIFVRELVSNACDAINKLNKLATLGEIPPVNDQYAVHVVIDKDNKTIQFIDNGIGMTADEIKQYINQIAFSGANEFINKYKDKLDQSNEIIGHFGLGFYSSFMVSDKVQIDSLSYQEGAQAARWICEGGIEFELTESDRNQRGTTITLFVNEESVEFLEEFKLRGILKKYCGFLPIEIYLEDAKKLQEEKEKAEKEPMDAEASESAESCDCGHNHEEGDECTCEHEDGEECSCKHDHADQDEPVSKNPPINDTKPLWIKQPKDCTDEEYKEFYNKVFFDMNEPLFWIHLNMDYPFRLKGILYFPKLKHELESIEGQVKLFSNQVFIADNVKEVIPEFLLLLKGTLDCPDLPLNVSRSFLQNDGYVTKMSSYIMRKVADKINSLYKNELESFSGYWDDISPFIKYGCIKDKDFYEKIKDSILYKTTQNDYVSLKDFLERNKEKSKDKVFYVTNEKQQAQYVKLFKDQGMEAVYLTTNLDNAFISYVESYDRGTKFTRIDAELSDSLKDSATDDVGNKELEELFTGTLNKKELKVKVESLKSSSVSAVILLGEESRRMQDMSRMFGGMNFGFAANDETLVLNKNNSLVQKLIELKDNEEKKDDVTLVCEHIYDLALMSHKPLEAGDMTKFIERSNLLLGKLV